MWNAALNLLSDLGILGYIQAAVVVTLAIFIYRTFTNGG